MTEQSKRSASVPPGKSLLSFRTVDLNRLQQLIVERSVRVLPACDTEMLLMFHTIQALYRRKNYFNELDNDLKPVNEDKMCQLLDQSDEAKLGHVIGWYRLVLENRKVTGRDMKIKSGWWGQEKNSLSAGKLKTENLKETLIQKNTEFYIKEHMPLIKEYLIDKPGVFIFLHKKVTCFQEVFLVQNIFQSVNELLHNTFMGSTAFDISALLLTSFVIDWDFYFLPLPILDCDDITSDRIQNIFFNDTVLHHDSLWPKGLNKNLKCFDYFGFQQLRFSASRHNWPQHSLPIQHEYLDTIDSLQKRLEECKRINSIMKSFDSDSIIDSSEVIDDQNNRHSKKCRVAATNIYLTIDDLKKRPKQNINSDSDTSEGSTVTQTTVRTAIDRHNSESNTNVNMNMTVFNDIYHNISHINLREQPVSSEDGQNRRLNQNSQSKSYQSSYPGASCQVYSISTKNGKKEGTKLRAGSVNPQGRAVEMKDAKCRSLSNKR